MNKLILSLVSLCSLSSYATMHMNLNCSINDGDHKVHIEKSLVINEEEPTELVVDDFHFKIKVHRNENNTFVTDFEISQNGNIISKPCMVIGLEQEGTIKITSTHKVSSLAGLIEKSIDRDMLYISVTLHSIT